MFVEVERRWVCDAAGRIGWSEEAETPVVPRSARTGAGHRRGEGPGEPPGRGHKGRITARRLLPEPRAAGYAGSARNFRRVLSRVKADFKRTGRTYRPWGPSPGEHLVIDWGEEGALENFCAVLPGAGTVPGPAES